METLKCINEARQRGGKKVMEFTLGKYYEGSIWRTDSCWVRDDEGNEQHFFDYTKLFKKVTKKQVDKEINTLIKKLVNKVLDSGINDLHIDLYNLGTVKISKYNPHNQDYYFYEEANCYDFCSPNERIEEINKLEEKLDSFLKAT